MQQQHMKSRHLLEESPGVHPFWLPFSFDRPVTCYSIQYMTGRAYFLFFYNIRLFFSSVCLIIYVIDVHKTPSIIVLSFPFFYMVQIDYVRDGLLTRF